ncbi:hypothetical protein N7507_010278 [Penicillium longicatenatum]|nr:hypothetical protein N7507_010278 [Penicillium longicatenatum]
MPHKSPALYRLVIRHSDLQLNNIFVSDDLKADIYRRVQLHYLYVQLTAKLNREHYEALTANLNTLRRRLFHHANDP